MVDVSQSLWLFVAAIGASTLGGALGMASGIFIVPILAGLFKIDIHAAVAASIVSVIACSCGSAAQFLRDRFTNIRVAIVLEVATTAGALCGVILSGVVPVSALYALFTVILLVSGWQMMMRRDDRRIAFEDVPANDMATTLRLHASYPDQEGGHIFYRVERVPLGLSLMFGAGLISALLGIGSGVLKIPAMDTALRLPIKVSSATSNFMIGVTAAASGLAYFVRGDIDPGIAGPVALGSVLGAVLGAKFLMSMSGQKVRIFFVCVLVALAVQMAFMAFGIGAGVQQ